MQNAVYRIKTTSSLLIGIAESVMDDNPLRGRLPLWVYSIRTVGPLAEEDVVEPFLFREAHNEATFFDGILQTAYSVTEAHKLGHRMQTGSRDGQSRWLQPRTQHCDRPTSEAHLGGITGNSGNILYHDIFLMAMSHEVEFVTSGCRWRRLLRIGAVVLQQIRCFLKQIFVCRYCSRRLQELILCRLRYRPRHRQAS